MIIRKFPVQIRIEFGFFFFTILHIRIYYKKFQERVFENLCSHTLISQNYK